MSFYSKIMSHVGEAIKNLRNLKRKKKFRSKSYCYRSPISRRCYNPLRTMPIQFRPRRSYAPSPAPNQQLAQRATPHRCAVVPRYVTTAAHRFAEFLARKHSGELKSKTIRGRCLNSGKTADWKRI